MHTLLGLKVLVKQKTPYGVAGVPKTIRNRSHEFTLIRVSFSSFARFIAQCMIRQLGAGQIQTGQSRCLNKLGHEYLHQKIKDLYTPLLQSIEKYMESIDCFHSVLRDSSARQQRTLLYVQRQAPQPIFYSLLVTVLINFQH